MKTGKPSKLPFVRALCGAEFESRLPRAGSVRCSDCDDLYERETDKRQDAHSACAGPDGAAHIYRVST